MDPNATLQLIARSQDRARREAIENLHTWIARGGFHPNWKSCPIGARLYRRAVGRGSDVRS